MTSSSPNLPGSDALRETFDETLKKVPFESEMRDMLLTLVRDCTESWSGKQLLSRVFLQGEAEKLLESNGFPPEYTGWAMVALAGSFWQKEITRVPHDRRVLLLPHCLRHSQKCQGTYNGDQLQCAHCGNCVLDSLIEEGRNLGYQILVAEGTPVVMQWILSGRADAILGVGCLNSLERAFEKLIWAGIPAMAVPLFKGSCKDTQTDVEQVKMMIRLPYIPEKSESSPPSWLPQLRAAAALFESEELRGLLGPICPDESDSMSDDPFYFVERQARDFLTAGGKFYRPFITLAAYDTVQNGIRTFDSGTMPLESIPLAVRRTALAMELFHKASLVHDDIEDDDLFRYGRPTLHRETGVPAAINIGDYLLGLGYRLIAAENELLPVIRTELLDELGSCHLRLCQGQGTELNWTARSARIPPRPLDILKMYSLKTAPAFEAALYAGLRLALNDEEFTPLKRIIENIAKYWGIAFQIRNDLFDWHPSQSNKGRGGDDFFHGRPTILHSFASAGLAGEELDELKAIADTSEEDPIERNLLLARVRRLYQKADAFSKAELLIEKYRAKSQELIQTVDNDSLARFLEHLTSVILR